MVTLRSCPCNAKLIGPNGQINAFRQAAILYIAAVVVTESGWSCVDCFFEVDRSVVNFNSSAIAATGLHRLSDAESG